MELTKDLVRKTIEEVAPLVEEVSERKNNPKKLRFKIKKIRSPMLYRIFPRLLLINSNSFYDTNYQLNEVLAHELAHDSEIYNFGMFPEYSDTNDKSIEINPFGMLSEGDATLISKIIKNKYFPNQKDLWVYSEKYLAWANILEKKFNGNRKDINELYTADPKDLIKIFGDSY